MELFRKGDSRDITNVISGTWKEMDFSAFSYSYTHEVGNHDLTFEFEVAMTRIETDLPPLQITTEEVVSGLADEIGLRDIQFESGEFNARFQVKSPQPKFAFELIDAQMMHWLLSVAGRFCFEVEGQTLVSYCKPLRPMEMLQPIGYLKEFRDHIPRLFMTKYGSMPDMGLRR